MHTREWHPGTLSKCSVEQLCHTLRSRGALAKSVCFLEAHSGHPLRIAVVVSQLLLLLLWLL